MAAISRWCPNLISTGHVHRAALLVGVLVLGEMAHAIKGHPESEVGEALGIECIAKGKAEAHIHEQSGPLYRDLIRIRQVSPGRDIYDYGGMAGVERKSIFGYEVGGRLAECEVPIKGESVSNFMGYEFYPAFMGTVKGSSRTMIRQGEPNSWNIVRQVLKRVTMCVASDHRSLALNKCLCISTCRLSGFAGFYGLPNDCAKGEQYRPCGYSFRPCYEFVPPLRLISAALLIVCAAVVCGYGTGRARLLCFPLAFCSGCLLLSGHRYWCGDDDSENSYPDQHNEESVTQKYLTRLYYCNTVIGMANVLPIDKQIAVIGALAEGSSIRSIERLTGIHRDTIMRLGVKVGNGCELLLDSKMQDLDCHYLQFDELWGFIGKKERHVGIDDDPEMGDVWTFCAIDSETKLVPSFLCGKRNHVTANAFVQDVASRMRNRVQISTDALNAYVEAVEQGFGADADYGQIVKVYTHDAAQHPERKYSAPSFASAIRRPISGAPEREFISTSHVERLNATTRLHVKRLNRLTLAFSKKLENFKAAVALHFAYYNLVKRHNTLRCTPAMAAGIEKDFWTVGDLVEAVS